MKTLLLITALITVSVIGICQERLVINGTAPVTIVENGGTFATPIYIEIGNPANNGIYTYGTKGWIVSENEFNKVKWDIGTTPGTDSIPFGHSTTYYLPLVVTIGTAGSAGGSLLFSTWHTQADNWTGLPANTNGPPSDVKSMTGINGQADDSYNVVDRFWTIDPYWTSYKYTTPPQLSNIKFSYISGASSPSEVIAPNTFTESKLLAQRYDTIAGAGGWNNFTGTAGTDAVNAANVGTVTSGAINTANFFRSWTLSSSDNPLPIKLLYFACSPISNGFQLSWATASEQDNKYFTIERSGDGINFSTLTTVAGAGNSVTPKYYTYVDMDPLKGNNYYRLSQTDDYGNTVQDNVSDCRLEDSVLVFPNPASGVFAVQLPVQATSSPTTIGLYDLLGRQLFTKTVQNQPIVNINVAGLAASIYLVNIITSENTYTIKLVIKK